MTGGANDDFDHSRHAAGLAARASARHPGRCQQRPAPGSRPRGPRHRRARAARPSPTATAAPTPTTTPPSGRRCSGTTTPTSTRAAAAAGRSVDLMGVGVTQVEVELAERLVDAVPSLEKVLLTCTGSEATFHALRLARTATGRRHVDQVPGLLPRLARRGRDERDLAGRARRHEGPALRRHAPGGRSRPPSSARSTTRTLSSARSTSTTGRRRDHPRADPAQHRRRPAAARLPRAAARARDQAWHRARLRRGDHRLPARARRLPGRRRGDARPDDARQGDGERLARLGARRQGRADGSLLDHARAARVLRRHVQRPPGDDGRSARDDREARARARARARLRAGRARPHGAPGSTTASACRPSSPASAPSSSPTSSRARRQLRRPAPERRRPVRRLPPRADEGRHLRAAAEPEAQPLLVRAHRRGRRPAARGDGGCRHAATWKRARERTRRSPARSTSPRPGKQRRAPRLPEDHEHRRLGEHVRPRSRRSGTARGRPCSCSPATTATSTRARSPRCGCSRSCSPSRSRAGSS